MTQRRPWFHYTLCAGLLSVAGAFPLAASTAQRSTTGAASSFAPVAAPRLAPDVFNTPSTPPNTDVATPKLDSDPPAIPAPKLPTGVNLGNFDLDFSVGRTKDIIPRTGYDSGELSNIEKIQPSKESSAMPDYFGLKLSTPTH